MWNGTRQVQVTSYWHSPGAQRPACLMVRGKASATHSQELALWSTRIARGGGTKKNIVWQNIAWHALVTLWTKVFDAKFFDNNISRSWSFQPCMMVASSQDPVETKALDVKPFVQRVRLILIWSMDWLNWLIWFGWVNFKNWCEAFCTTCGIDVPTDLIAWLIQRY